MPAARPGIGMPGGMLTVSCNRADPGTGVLWALHPVEGDANHATVAGMLQAYRAVRSVQSVSAGGSFLLGVLPPRLTLNANIKGPHARPSIKAFTDPQRSRGLGEIPAWGIATNTHPGGHTAH